MRYSIFYLQVTKRHWVLSFKAINLFVTTEAKSTTTAKQVNSDFEHF